MSSRVSATMPATVPNMSCACVGLPSRHAPLARSDTSREPWLRWSNAAATSRCRRPLSWAASPTLCTMIAPMLAIVAREPSRGWCSHSIVTDSVSAGSSSRP